MLATHSLAVWWQSCDFMAFLCEVQGCNFFKCVFKFCGFRVQGLPHLMLLFHWLYFFESSGQLCFIMLKMIKIWIIGWSHSVAYFVYCYLNKWGYPNMTYMLSITGISLDFMIYLWCDTGEVVWTFWVSVSFCVKQRWYHLLTLIFLWKLNKW